MESAYRRSCPYTLFPLTYGILVGGYAFTIDITGCIFATNPRFSFRVVDIRVGSGDDKSTALLGIIGHYKALSWSRRWQVDKSRSLQWHAQPSRSRQEQ